MALGKNTRSRRVFGWRLEEVVEADIVQGGAVEAKVEMCRPDPDFLLLVRMTMAVRSSGTIERIAASMNRSPGIRDVVRDRGLVLR